MADKIEVPRSVGDKRMWLEFECGVLVKVNGMRPEYMDGNQMVRLIKDLAMALRAHYVE